jgi:DNA repair protein RadD
VLCNCLVFTEGFDEPSASCLILARPTKLLTMYRQMSGRVLRPYPGKVDARIIDHSGAVYRHGYPDDEISWALSPDDKAVNETAEARAAVHKRELLSCPKCTAVRLAGQGCSACGWQPETKPTPLVVDDGELGHVHRDRSVTAEGWSTERRLNFYRQLLDIAQRRNRKPGWAAYRYKEKFGGDFPPWNWNDLGPLPPDPGTVAWVRSRDIAFAKAMGPRRWH